MIDLHTHSTFSDGTKTPTELIEMAHTIGLKAIALTDHDVIDGIEEFQKAAQKYPDLMAINGTELAVHHTVNIEILALGIGDLTPYRHRQNELKDIRSQANEKRLKALQALGLDISWQDVAIDENGKPRALIGKPHFAQALFQKGYIRHPDEAYSKYLNKGCPAYVQRQNPTLKETIDFIRQTDAFAVLAHPILTGLNNTDLFELLKNLKSMGLQGVEVFHSDQSEEQSKTYFKMTQELNLIATGGSDYHGDIHPDVKLGTGKGTLYISDALLTPFFQKNQR